MFEKYHKEDFEEAQEKAEIEEKRSEAIPYSTYRNIKMELAQMRAERILGKGQKEAQELNEEYERFKQNALDAVEALETFERKKLGMKEKEEN